MLPLRVGANGRKLSLFLNDDGYAGKCQYVLVSLLFLQSNLGRQGLILFVHLEGKLQIIVERAEQYSDPVTEGLIMFLCEKVRMGSEKSI